METTITPNYFNGIFLFLGATLAFVIIRRLLYVDLLRLLAAITKNVLTAHKIHFAVVFPGVVLHEFSHFLALRLMGVRCRLHLGVEMQDDFVVYGHVDFYENEVNGIQHFISGIAPLLTGLTVISLISVNFMGVPSIRSIIESSGILNFSPILASAGNWWFWLAFYFVFAIASEMIPSPADRRYWIHLGMILVILFAISLLTKTTGWFLINLYPTIDGILKMVGITFVICLAIEVILFLPLRLINWLRAM
ncbi:MAG: hypothetical protein V2J07_04370 [Anaerolineae bacterium]|jgi:hypothetical protein|nr:hypothetical protein [Anaerolineae bacterium]